MRSSSARFSAACALFLALSLAPAAAAGAVRYSLSLANPEKHYLEVTAQVDAVSAAPIDFRLPVWNALYQVRDFAQYVSEVRAGGGARVQKIEKSAWRVTPASAGTVELRYRYYADQPGPFGTQLDARHAFINPAQVLVFTDQHRREPVELRLAGVPSGWKVATALEEGPDSAWRARHYDHLADSPFEISDFEEASFSAGGGNYRIVVHAARDAYSMSKLREMVERIVSFQTRVMQDVPFRRFTLFYHFREGGGGGGMEHADSTAMEAGPQRGGGDARRLAGLTAHEVFHLWNVKRIRPTSLEPVDYTREQYSRALWFAEGVTSTYGAYTMLRAGLLSREQFLEEVARDIRTLESRPARLQQSVEESSLDAWLEKYNYYNSAERSISYYLKGKLVGFLLDLAIRHATENRRGLDDVMRLLNERFARAGKFYDDRRDIQAAAEAVAGQPLAAFFEDLVRQAKPVAYQHYLQMAGLQLRQEQRSAGSLGFRPVRGSGRVYTVQDLAGGGPAEKAGVREGDELLQINGKDAREVIARGPDALSPGDKVRLKLRRNGREIKVSYRAGREATAVLFVEPAPNPSPAQQRVLEGWLTGKTDE